MATCNDPAAPHHTGWATSAAAVAAALGVDQGDPIDPDRIYHVDPDVLILGPNARTDGRPDPEFTASITERGVLQPITCYRDELGQLIVHMGQRRAFTASQVELGTVPIRVIDRPDDVDRIADQVVENDQRTGLSTAERTAAVQQLAAFGIPAAQIAKRVALRRVDVDTALAVAASPIAADAAAQYDLTLDQAAAVADFADDHEVVEELLSSARDGRGFDHVVQRARDERRDAADRAAAAATLRATGVTVLEERPPWKGPSAYLSALQIREAEHAACTGHAAYMVQRYDIVDGHRALTWQPEWVCQDAKGNGHRAPRHGAAAGQGSLTELEREELAEAERAQRALVIARNKEWRSAESVRRTWLRGFAQGKTVPPDAERFIATCLLRGDAVLGQAMGWDSQHQKLRDLMGLDREAHDAPGYAASARSEIDLLVAQLATASPKRAIRLTAVLLLAAWEERTGVHTWRHHSEENARYLGQMEYWGYQPSPVERLLLVEPAQPTTGPPS